jgi:hypothetical protein
MLVKQLDPIFLSGNKPVLRYLAQQCLFRTWGEGIRGMSFEYEYLRKIGFACIIKEFWL